MSDNSSIAGASPSQSGRAGFDEASALFAGQAGQLASDLTAAFGEEFEADSWSSTLGEGVVRLIRDGAKMERASINYSLIAGDSFPATGLPDGSALLGAPYRATGLSLIFHPRNPLVPSTHLNVRLLSVDAGEGGSSWWFGGGFDLTPYFPFDEDCRSWHSRAAELCNPYGAQVYERYKRQCDDYFYLPHRQECRGIGGIFFDQLHEWGWERCLSFASRLAPAWQAAWREIAERRIDCRYDERQRQFQLYRRGRYAEFNLLYDRGTRFGLQSGGLVENILASMPPHCCWGYQLDQREFADYAHQLAPYLRPKAWLSESSLSAAAI